MRSHLLQVSLLAAVAASSMALVSARAQDSALPPGLEQQLLGPEYTGPENTGPQYTGPEDAAPKYTGPEDTEPSPLRPRDVQPPDVTGPVGPPAAPDKPNPKEAAPAPGGPAAPDNPGAGNRDAGNSSTADQAGKAPPDREAVLAELYAHLAQAKDAQEAEPIAKAIEGLWAHSDSPTIGLLMARASKAVTDQRPELALKLLDAVVELSPDYAEGWNRRAYVYYMQNDVEHAAGDLRRALALDPKNYKALEGLARILRDGGQKKGALGAYQELLRIYPASPGAKDAAKELTTEVEGQGI
jgi:tetratricopeptide (TPR) repeat protein